MRGSSACDRSHQTVAFCLRRRATYEVGDGPVDLPDDERRIELCCEAVVEDVEEVALERVRRVEGFGEKALFIALYDGCD
jgi:hypothetical protein